jgi:hypothetical protein
MKWTDKRIKEYLNDGNEIMVSAGSEPNGVCWVQWVRLKMQNGGSFKTRYMLTTDIYDEFTKYDKRRVKAFLGDHTCFQYFYNKRLNAYEAERNALDNQNAPTNP